VWALRAAVDHRNDMIEAALTSLERVGYYLGECKSINSELKTELSKLININEVNKEIQK